MGMSAGMGMQIIGTELQGWSSILAQQAMKQALADELKRQQGFRLNATGQQFQQLPRQGAENAGKEIAAGATERENNYKSMYNYPQATGADKAAIATEGKSRAGLAGYGDWQTDRSVDASKLGAVIGRINQRSAGDASVFPYQMNAAQHSQDMLAAIGQAISSLGGGASNIGQAQQSNPTQLSQQTYGPSTGANGYDPVTQNRDPSFDAGGTQAITSLY